MEHAFFAFIHASFSGTDSWGNKKKYFYGGNPNEKRRGAADEKLDDDEEDEAELEARETAKLQIKQLEQMDEEDFLDAFAVSEQSAKKRGKKGAKAKESEDTTVKFDVSKLSKREKVKLFEQESPEFDAIVADFEQKMTLARTELVPVVELIDAGRIPEGPAADYVKAKLNVILSYSSNVACYLMFKTRRTQLRFHPVTGRLVQYKQLLDEMESSPVDSAVMEQGRNSIHLRIRINATLFHATQRGVHWPLAKREYRRNFLRPVDLKGTQKPQNQGR